jgi:hypothetical protein
MLKDKANRDLDGLKIGMLDACEVGETGGVLSRGIRDNLGRVAWSWPRQPCPSCCPAGIRRVSRDDTVRGRS